MLTRILAYTYLKYVNTRRKCRQTAAELGTNEPANSGIKSYVSFGQQFSVKFMENEM